MRRRPILAFAALALVGGGTWGYLEYVSNPGSTSSLPKDSGPPAPAPAPNRMAATEAVSSAPPSVKTASAKMLEALAAKLPALAPEARDAAIRELLSELHAAGPAGLQAILEFLRTGQDFPLREGYTLTKNRLQLAPSLRLALLDGALDFEGHPAVMLEVLRTPRSLGEIEFAVRNLEQRFPGTYRTEALAALEKALSTTKPDDFDPHQAYFLGAIQHFKATELLPTAERLVTNGSPFLAASYAQALAAFPVEVRRPALTRLFAEPKVVAYLVDESRGFNDLDYSDPELGAQVAQLYAQRLSAQQRSNFLQGFNGSPRQASAANFYQSTTPQDFQGSPRIADALPDLRGRKALLAQLSPVATTPGEQNELAAAKREVTAEIAWRETATRSDRLPLEPMDVPIGAGVGRAVIKGKRIETLELTPP